MTFIENTQLPDTGPAEGVRHHADGGLTDAWSAETNGQIVTVRCTLDDCPLPRIGVFAADFYHRASGQHAADLHWFGQHYLPIRQQQILDGMNANPSTLEAITPGISDLMSELGLRFAFGAP